MPMLVPTNLIYEFAPALTAGYWSAVTLVVIGESAAAWIGLSGFMKTVRLRRSLLQARTGTSIGIAALATYSIIAAAGVGGLGFLINEIGFRARAIRLTDHRIELVNYFDRVIVSIETQNVQSIDFARDNPRNGYCTIRTVQGAQYCTVRFDDSSVAKPLRSALNIK